jgi:(p)ppGpp synthase/HD superfamily hydrolase
MAVAKLVADFGGDSGQVTASLLHDTVEDVAAITHKIIASNFGKDVAMLVHGMTKHEYPEGTLRADKKFAEAERMSLCDPRVQFIKCCDITHNCGDIIPYDAKFGRVYLDEAVVMINKMVTSDVTEYAMAIVKGEQIKVRLLLDI